MGALNENALLLEFADVSVGDDAGSVVDLGAVRNVTFNGVQNPIDILSDNRGSVVRKNRLNGSVTFDWLEGGDPDALENLFKGLITKTVVAGTPVAGATDPIDGTGKDFGDFLEIEFQNGDGSALTINSVTGSVDGALVADTDFQLVKNGQGKYGIAIIDSATVTTMTQTFTVDYDYTPNASSTVAGGTSKVSTPRYVKIEGASADDPTKKRTVILTSAVPEADLVLPFLDTEEAGDVGVIPVTMTNDKNASWSFTDEINPS